MNTITVLSTDNVPVTVVTQAERNELQRRNLLVEIARIQRQADHVGSHLKALKAMRESGDNLGWEIQHGDAITALQEGILRLMEQESRMQHIVNTIPR